MGCCPSKTRNHLESHRIVLILDLSISYKEALIKIAYAGFKKSRLQASEFEVFCSQNKMWLDDYALYFVLSQKTGKPWYEWLPSLRHREHKTLARKQQLFAPEIEQTKFAQYLFYSQWRRLKEHCQKRGIKIIGDIPFYVAHDSADIWVAPRTLQLCTAMANLVMSAAYHPIILAQLGSFGATPSTIGKSTKKQGLNGG